MKRADLETISGALRSDILTLLLGTDCPMPIGKILLMMLW